MKKNKQKKQKQKQKKTKQKKQKQNTKQNKKTTPNKQKRTNIMKHSKAFKIMHLVMRLKCLILKIQQVNLILLNLMLKIC